MNRKDTRILVENWRNLISERNQPHLVKKPYPYDLLIADLSPKVAAKIYKDFQDERLSSNLIFFDAVVMGEGFNDNDFSPEENYQLFLDANFSIIQLKKNKLVIDYLKNNFNFNFNNCNLNDSKPILCVPARSLMGDTSNAHKISQDSLRKMIKDQTIENLEQWNWAAHDFHHGETALNTLGDTFIDKSKISNIDLPAYESPLTGYEYMDKHSSYSHYDQKSKIKDYWLTLIGLYFNKIGFTRGVEKNDIWASIYAYCLNKMSSAEDAYNIDFKVVNEAGKKTLIVGKGEIKVLQDFFYNAYKTVHTWSYLDSLSDNSIYIALMF